MKDISFTAGLHVFSCILYSFLTTEHMRILPSGSAMGHTVKIKPDHSMPSPTPADSEVSMVSSNSATVSEEAQAATGFNHSPFPSVDSFITSQLTKGGVQGSIRRWTYFPTGALYFMVCNDIDTL